jgi:hypothetical protein
MQSSESVHGYTGRNQDKKKSIEAGVDFLLKAIETSKKENVDIWAAVQAYNFGLPYIDYVQLHGGQNTVKLAKTYSREVVAPSLGTHTGAMYDYVNPISLYYNETKLYSNGGNFLYAEIVQFNEHLLAIFG